MLAISRGKLLAWRAKNQTSAFQIRYRGYCTRLYQLSALQCIYLNGGGPGGDSCRGPTTPSPMLVFDKLIACELLPLVDVPGEVVTDPKEPFDNAAPGGSWVGEFLSVLALCIGDNCFPWGGPLTNVSSGGAGADGPEPLPYNDVGILEVEAPTVVCGKWGGEVAAGTVVSCDVEGNGAGFLLCFSRLVLSLCSLGSLCFLGSFTSNFLDSLASLSRSLASRCS